MNVQTGPCVGAQQHLRLGRRVHKSSDARRLPDRAIGVGITDIFKFFATIGLNSLKLGSALEIVARFRGQNPVKNPKVVSNPVGNPRVGGRGQDNGAALILLRLDVVENFGVIGQAGRIKCRLFGEQAFDLRCATAQRPQKGARMRRAGGHLQQQLLCHVGFHQRAIQIHIQR